MRPLVHSSKLLYRLEKDPLLRQPYNFFLGQRLAKLQHVTSQLNDCEADSLISFVEFTCGTAPKISCYVVLFSSKINSFVDELEGFLYGRLLLRDGSDAAQFEMMELLSNFEV